MEGNMEDDMEGGIEDYMEGSIEDNMEAGIEDFNKWIKVVLLIFAISSCFGNAKDVQRKSFWNRCDICMYAIDGIGKFRNAEPEITDNKLAETVCEHLKDDSSSIPNEEDKRFCYHVMGYALSDQRLQARILVVFQSSAFYDFSEY
ncbi:hypothetical protein OESDEN_02621 [Oesophagostomum dentatum]|uniref:Uncharacterized protein n=1 Tax=Oesophagostomum dentatum TaxID=61180 RepID=A0A0B1TNH9_OESDE|nr:hypothetical protein OESDEN_02621 [Oesophagostomum dentatum]